MRYLHHFILGCALFALLLNFSSNSVEGASLHENVQDKLLEQNAKPPPRRAREEQEVTLISFLKKAVKKYGEKKVAISVHELAQRSMYDLIWLLAGDLTDPWLIYDLYTMYNTGSSDAAVVSVYERFRAGQVNRTIVPEVFALDKKYNEFGWYRRVRSRMLENVDKYMAGNLKITSTPPKIEFTPDGKPIIEGKPEDVVAAVIASSTTSTTSTIKSLLPSDEDIDDDENSEDLDEDLDLDEFIALQGFVL